METTKPQGATLYSVLNYIDRILPYYFSITNLAFPTGWLVSRNILGEPSAFKNADEMLRAHIIFFACGWRQNTEYWVVTKGFLRKGEWRLSTCRNSPSSFALCMWVGGCILFFFFFFSLQVRKYSRLVCTTLCNYDVGRETCWKRLLSFSALCSHYASIPVSVAGPVRFLQLVSCFFHLHPEGPFFSFPLHYWPPYMLKWSTPNPRRDVILTPCCRLLRNTYTISDKAILGNFRTWSILR